MDKRLRLFLKKQIIKDNSGTTLIEMIVCFALMGIFMAAAATIISSIVSLYFNIKGEIYSREVSDIIIGKVTSELDGAEYFESVSMNNPKFVVSDDHANVDLIDKTDTHIEIGLDETGRFVVHYHDIIHKNNGVVDSNTQRSATDWYFNENMYNGFEVEDLRFYCCGEQDFEMVDYNQINTDTASEYGLSGVDLADYDGNVVLVLLKLHSSKYGEYTYHAYVRLYNLPKDYKWTAEEPNEDDNT